MTSDQEESMFDRSPRQDYPIWNCKALEEYLQMEPNPRGQLDKWSLVEVDRIKRGTVYKCVHADTPEFREAAYYKTLCFQMIAHSEGWKFDPNSYRVIFLPPNHQLLQNLSDGQMRRVYLDEFDSEEIAKAGQELRAKTEHELRQLGSSQRLHYKNIAGFRIVGKDGIRIEDDEADGLAREVNDILKDV